MAKFLGPFDDPKLNRQFNEILNSGITNENVDEDNLFILTSPDGTKYRLVVDNSGNLSTEKV